MEHDPVQHTFARETGMRDAMITVGGHDIELSNLDKVLFPESGITKGDLIAHYRRVAEVALPHYRDRPLSMHRFPDGIGKQGFFQKDIPDYFPEWIKRVELRKQDGSVTYVVADDEATLVWLANQACITPHLFPSRRDRPDHPDRLVFDLDPPGEDFEAVRRAAQRLRELLDELKLVSYVQTTGSRGLHVVVPLDRKGDYEAARKLARGAADCLAQRHPGELTVEQRKTKRGDRVFIDYLRNAFGQTTVAPYAVRARQGAPVATPLDWHEVAVRDLHARRYTVRNIARRLGQKADPWQDIGRHGQSVEAAAKRLSGVIGRSGGRSD